MSWLCSCGTLLSDYACECAFCITSSSDFFIMDFAPEKVDEKEILMEKIIGEIIENDFSNI